MRFMKNYGRVAPYAPAYAMNDEFSRVLHQQMEFFSSNPSADTLNRVRGEVGEVCIFSCYQELHCLFIFQIDFLVISMVTRCNACCRWLFSFSSFQN